METLQILGWIYLGIILGSLGSIVGLSLFQVRNVADLKAEIRDLRLQRTLLKEGSIQTNQKRQASPKKKKKLKWTSKKIG